MGEAKLRAAAADIANSAQPIEAAWQKFSAAFQTDQRTAFFAGAAMMFEAVVYGSDPESEPTEADMARMSRIAAELQNFAAFLVTLQPTKGQA